MSQRLLIIDDDAWLSESYAAILKKGGYEVETVTDAEQALRAIEQRPPDGVVADIMLHSQTVFALLHELQSYDDTRTIPVILCTGLDAPLLEKDRFHSYGVQAVLKKATLTPDQLLLAIREGVGE